MLSLPAELYIFILQHVDYKSLLKCMQVCSLFRELINDSASLQYAIELAAAGQVNGPETPGTSSSSRLKALKKHQSSWDNLKWSRELRIPMEDGGLWELYGGVLAQSTVEGTLTFMQLPSDLRSIEEKVWTIGPKLGLVVRDFGMDPSQDLLVLIESPDWNMPAAARKHSIHLRSLSDGKPHPLARDAPVLYHAQGTRGRSVSYTIQVSGTFIAIHFRLHNSTELCIWNWMTGELQVNVRGKGIRSFSLLSDTCVLLATCDDFGPQLVVMDFQNESSEPHTLQDLQCAVKLCYPEFDQKRVFFLDIDIRADPGPSWRPNAKLQVPFSQDTSNALFVVSLWIFLEDAVQSLIQFLPSNGLTSLIKNEATSYEWEEWGPYRSRFFIAPQLHSETWVCYVHGWKYVTLEPGASEDGFVARLYDFNQVVIKRNYRDTRTSADIDRWLCNRTGTVLAPGTIFKDLVETRLPYRSQVLSLKDAHNHCLVLCSEDHIIMVDPECREYRVLIF